MGKESKIKQTDCIGSVIYQNLEKNFKWKGILSIELKINLTYYIQLTALLSQIVPLQISFICPC